MIKKLWLKIVIGVILVGALAGGGYFYYQYRVAQNTAEKQVQKVVAEVGKLMILPSETPTLATVTDVTKLSNQKFFKNAQNGDQVLIYPQTAKAILYRPNVNKIVEVATVDIGNTAVTAVPTMVPSGPVAVTIYNGTPTVGLAAKIEKLLKPDGVTVTDRETATSTDYQQTVVMDISGHSAGKVAQIADTLGARIINQLPVGESKPNSDILIIIGKDKQ